RPPDAHAVVPARRRQELLVARKSDAVDPPRGVTVAGGVRPGELPFLRFQAPDRSAVRPPDEPGVGGDGDTAVGGALLVVRSFTLGQVPEVASDRQLLVPAGEAQAQARVPGAGDRGARDRLLAEVEEEKHVGG